jgi:hypothetical protein
VKVSDLGIMEEEQKQLRTGLRIRCLGIDPYVRKSCLKFVKWLRKQIDFPIRVVVYLKKDYYIKNRKGELVSATFFGPYDKTVEPYIRVATGDFKDLWKECGKISAKCSILNSIAHEIAHYEQWINDEKMLERPAKKRAEELMNKYGYVRCNTKNNKKKPSEAKK